MLKNVRIIEMSAFGRLKPAFQSTEVLHIVLLYFSTSVKLVLLIVSTSLNQIPTNMVTYGLYTLCSFPLFVPMSPQLMMNDCSWLRTAVKHHKP